MNKNVPQPTFEARIGLEIHAELKTRTKMFCSCKNDPDQRHPNVNVCPVCLGHPGTLPVPNAEAIRLTQRVGAAFGSTLAHHAKFDRKNYFYPDLPKGYQISQYDMPFCEGGALELFNGTSVRVTRIHLEEDTGKLLHPEGEKYSVVDFNRAGVPLMEFVTEPDLQNAEEVGWFAEELQRILRYLHASDANMEKGEMRVEVNISLQTKGQKELSGTKVEIKNLNSIRSARMAVAYEIERQARLLETGQAVVQETRGWHDTKQVTFSQRSKEEAHDYRYFPEPDIPSLRFNDEEFEILRAEIPELPAGRRRRFVKEYGLAPQDVTVFVDDREFGDYFEKVISELLEWQSAEKLALPQERLYSLAVSYLTSDLRGLLVEQASTVRDISITPENFAELVKLVAQEKITSRVAKDVLREMYGTGADPSDIVEEKGLMQVSDSFAIEEIARKVVAENPQPAADFRSGKEASLQFLVGKLMAKTKGKANPKMAAEMLRKLLA